MIPCKIRWKPILKSIFKNQEWLFTFFDTNRKFNIHHFWPPICIKHYYTILQPKNKAKVHIKASSVVAMGIYCLTVKYFVLLVFDLPCWISQYLSLHFHCIFKDFKYLDILSRIVCNPLWGPKLLNLDYSGIRTDFLNLLSSSIKNQTSFNLDMNCMRRSQTKILT